jgi:hypothetical protein
MSMEGATPIEVRFHSSFGIAIEAGIAEALKGVDSPNRFADMK